MPKAWLRAGVVGLSVPPEGLWIGRSADCDLVVADHRASQLHAHVGWRGEHLVLLALGRNPTRRNALPTEGMAALAAGDRIEVPGGAWTVDLSPTPPTPTWVAVLPSGDRVGLGRRELSLGSGPEDDVGIPGWPAAAVRLHRPGSGALLVEARLPLWLGERACEAGGIESVPPGTRLRVGTVEVTLLALDDGRAATTLLAQEGHLPTRVTFAFTPTGGQLALSFAGDPRTAMVELPELRARLLAVLLRTPGAEVEDEDLLTAVWPGSADRGRLDLNQLVHRARKDLVAAGVDPTEILIRVRRGGAACFRMATGATVTVS